MLLITPLFLTLRQRLLTAVKKIKVINSLLSIASELVLKCLTLQLDFGLQDSYPFHHAVTVRSFLYTYNIIVDL